MNFQLHKIKQYGVLDLVRIASYRILYKLIMAKRHINVVLFLKKYPILKGKERMPYVDTSLYERYCFHDKQEVVNIANRILSGETYLFGCWYKLDYKKDWLKDPVTNGYWDNLVYANSAPFVSSGLADVKYVLELNKLAALVDVALAYHHTKDIKYVEYIKVALEGWKANVLPERSVANRIVMDIAYRSINLTNVCMLCKDCELFKKDVKPHILGILKHHESYMWERLSSRWFKSQNDNNHNVGELVGLLVVQMWLTSCIGERYNWKMIAENRYLVGVLNKIVRKSGGYIEQSGNYTKVVCEFLMAFEIISKTLKFDQKDCFKDYYSNKYLQRLSQYLCNITYDDKIDNFGDNDGAIVLPAFEKDIYSIKHISEYTGQIQSDVDYKDVSQWIYNSKGQDNLHVFMRVGKFAYYVEGAYIHAHNDLLSVLLSAKGSQIFIDKGCYFYNSGLTIKDEYTSYNAHNSVTVDNLNLSDLMKVGFKNYPDSELVKESHDDKGFSVCAELRYKGITHNRSLSYSNGTVTISDNLKAGDYSNHNAVISYLLAPQLSVHNVTGNVIALKDTINNNVFNLMVDGINKMKIVEDCYYPSYGIKSKTIRIVANVSFVNSISLNTTLSL